MSRARRARRFSKRMHGVKERHRASGPFTEKMLPGEEPYTPDELTTLYELLRDAADGDPGEEGEVEMGSYWLKEHGQ